MLSNPDTSIPSPKTKQNDISQCQWAARKTTKSFSKWDPGPTALGRLQTSRESNPEQQYRHVVDRFQQHIYTKKKTIKVHFLIKCSKVKMHELCKREK